VSQKRARESGAPSRRPRRRSRRGTSRRAGGREYDELAILSFVVQAATSIVAAVLELQAGLRARFNWLGERDALSLGASLAAPAGELGAQARAELLPDMQTIVTATGRAPLGVSGNLVLRRRPFRRR
jgi:hypothetical protein